jgi:hypothetical protein
MCGKDFIPAAQHYWAIGSWGYDERSELVCSYSCMRKWEKEQEAKDRRKRRKKQSDREKW